MANRERALKQAVSLGGSPTGNHYRAVSRAHAAVLVSQDRRGGLWADAWRRLWRNPEAVFGLVVIGLFLFVAVFANWLAPYSMNEINFKQGSLPPAWVNNAPPLPSGDPAYLLGTDRMGRDLLSWAIAGTRTSLLLGLISAPVIALIGLLIGLISGYAGGRLDNLLMRFTDVFYSFPSLVIVILVVMIFRDTPLGGWKNGFGMLLLAFLAVGWAGAARLVRSSVLMVKELEYIEAARCIGVPVPRLLFRHILPNCLSPLLVWVTLIVPQLILMEAVLGYLQIRISAQGYGDAYLDASWGGMIRQGRALIHSQPVVLLIPAVCVGLVSIAFTFLGDGLRDALDPENKER